MKCFIFKSTEGLRHYLLKEKCGRIQETSVKLIPILHISAIHFILNILYIIFYIISSVYTTMARSKNTFTHSFTKCIYDYGII